MGFVRNRIVEVIKYHLNIMLSVLRIPPDFLVAPSVRFGKTFQNRRVSSPAPVTIVLPSGLIARYRTR